MWKGKEDREVLSLLGFPNKLYCQNPSWAGMGGYNDENSFCFGLTLPFPLPQKEGRNGTWL